MRHFKNRITLYFDSEGENTFRLYFATLEQVNTFLMYLRKCVCLDYLAYTFESMKTQETDEEIWSEMDSQQIEYKVDSITRRTSSAPYKVCVHFFATRKTQEFDFNLYCFSPLDADYLAALIAQGASVKYRSFKLKHFKRNRETKEWEPRAPMRSVPEHVAAAYYALSPSARDQVVSVIGTLG